MTHMVACQIERLQELQERIDRVNSSLNVQINALKAQVRRREPAGLATEATR